MKNQSELGKPTVNERNSLLLRVAKLIEILIVVGIIGTYLSATNTVIKFGDHFLKYTFKDGISLTRHNKHRTEANTLESLRNNYGAKTTFTEIMIYSLTEEQSSKINQDSIRNNGRIFDFNTPNITSGGIYTAPVLILCPTDQFNVFNTDEESKANKSLYNKVPLEFQLLDYNNSIRHPNISPEDFYACTDQYNSSTYNPFILGILVAHISRETYENGQNLIHQHTVVDKYRLKYDQLEVKIP